MNFEDVKFSGIQEDLLGYLTMTRRLLLRSRTRWGRVTPDADGSYWRFEERGNTMQIFSRRFYFTGRVVWKLIDEGRLVFVFNGPGWVAVQPAGSYQAKEVR